MSEEQMICRAQSFKTEVIILENKPKDKILSHLHSDSPRIIAFSVLGGLEDLTQEL